MKKLSLLTILVFAKLVVFSQKGPGGVSTEVVGDSDCKLWLDAGSFNLADGAFINTWPDESLSANDNTPTQGNASLQPIYRNDPAANINGQPIVRFGGGKYLEFVSKPDLNTSGPYTEKTYMASFRTGADVTTQQFLYEQGGNVRGLNMYIENGFLIMGGYDNQNDGDGTPSWVYTSTKAPIQANTTYVVSLEFYGPLGATTGFIRGHMNGEAFQSIDAINGVPAANVGSLWSHPNEPGLGAIVGQTVIEGNVAVNSNGASPFLGDFAELILYNKILNNAERIILENYLGAKYFANLSVNDYYDYQDTYFNDVIGVGRKSGGTDIHTLSQGRNDFEIEVQNANLADEDFFITGHNKADNTTWSALNAPYNGNQVQRIQRLWRADHTNDVGNITFTIDTTTLPAKPAGYTKYVLIIDETNGVTPNINNPATRVLEMTYAGSGSFYEVTTSIADGAYITLGIVDPLIEFIQPSDFAFETDVDFTTNTTLQLNYRPATPVNVDFTFADNTAIFGGADDYTNFNPNPPAGFATIPVLSDQGSINFDIVGDLIPENTEDFTITLLNGANTTSDLDIGGNNPLTFTIYDNDNTPEIGFAVTSASSPENSGTVTIEVVRSGNTGPAVSVDYQLKIPNGTATDGVDYTFVSGTLNFASGVTSQTFTFDIIDDLIDEPNETVIFELVNVVDADIIAANKEHTHTIIDDDATPTVQFVISASQNAESVGAPIIEVNLTAPSAQIITVQYQFTGGTATYGVDYTIPNPGTLIFMPGDTLQTINLSVVNDGVNEPDETILIDLLNPSNTSIGLIPQHEYTIKDYSSFEWLGLAGVGMPVDNIMWLDAQDLGYANGTTVDDFFDRSPNNNSPSAAPGFRATYNTTGINGIPSLTFDGGDEYEIADDANINTNASYRKKDFSIVVETGANVTTRQLIYEEGGGTNGINIYIDNGLFYFHIWSQSTGWGGTGANAVFVTGAANPNTAYILSLSYYLDGVGDAVIEGFINGQSVGTSTGSNGGSAVLNSHGDEGGLGGVIGSTLCHDGTNPGNFTGEIAELVYYSDSPYNTTRRIIVENHFSSKYGITLSSNQKYPLVFAAGYPNELAGIGQFSASDNHGDAQGTAIVRIKNPTSLGTNDFLLWAHDGATTAITIAPENIPGVDNRMHRVWRASEPGGDVGGVNISFDLNAFAIASPGDLVLLVDLNDGIFTDCDQYPISSFAGGVAQFNNINLDNGNWFTIGSRVTNNPLPIELLEFKLVQNESSVDLLWKTATESNVSHYNIQLRNENNTNIETIGDVQVAGNTSVTQSYFFKDRAPLNGTSYYRIQIVDEDGSKTYTNWLSSNFTSTNELNVEVYPNPSKGQFWISASGLTNGAISLRIIDLNGKLVHDESFSTESVAFQKQIDLTQYETGMYILQFVQGDSVVTKKLIKQQ